MNQSNLEINFRSQGSPALFPRIYISLTTKFPVDSKVLALQIRRLRCDLIIIMLKAS